jgi:hypothetical protein
MHSFAKGIGIRRLDGGIDHRILLSLVRDRAGFEAFHAAQCITGAGGGGKRSAAAMLEKTGRNRTTYYRKKKLVRHQRTSVDVSGTKQVLYPIVVFVSNYPKTT